MASSSLDPDERKDRSIGSGHGTRALGPSDTSDSGSDLQGAPGMAQQVGIGGDTDTMSNPEESTAGPDIGDADLDSDTDSSGTGERAAAGLDTLVRDGQDIDVDHIENIDPNEVRCPGEKNNGGK
jgi:hypothetical protein